MNWKSPILLTALVFGLAASGCGKSDNNSNNHIIGGPDAGSADTRDPKDIGETTDADKTGDTKEEGDTGPTKDAGHNPRPDGSTGSDATGSDASGTDASGDGGFIPFDTSRPDTSGPDVSGVCGNIDDLGELAFGAQQMTVVFNLDNDLLRTSCRDFNAESKPEKVYKFQVAQQSVLTLEASPDYTFELRQDPCGDESSVITCNPNGSLLGQTLYPGVDYYLIVELEGVIEDFTDSPQDSEYFFNMSVSSPFAECRPGVSECSSSSEVKICSAQGSYETRSCPTSCADGSCVGDTCDNPIVVDGSSSLQADIGAFGNKILGYTCGQGSGAQSKSGQEVVFLAENLRPNHTITVTASGDSIENTIIIQRDVCGMNAACEYQGASGAESVVYQVQRAGNYYIIIDADDAATGNANYHVSVN